MFRILIAVIAAPLLLIAQDVVRPPADLPPAAQASLARALAAAAAHTEHVWRDTPACHADDGTVTVYVEISRGDSRKWELDMASNRRAVDRVLPDELGGYPINYGIVPQTIGYDGDPFDALVTGPPLPGGSSVRGHIVGIMRTEDENGADPKAVVAPAADGGTLDEAARARIERFFNTYKRHEPGKFSRVTGWGDAAEGRAFVTATHGFFSAAVPRTSGGGVTPDGTSACGASHILARDSGPDDR